MARNGKDTVPASAFWDNAGIGKAKAAIIVSEIDGINLIFPLSE
jgi:hypothetical protein